MVDLAAWEQLGLFVRRSEPIAGDTHAYHTMDIPGRGLVTGAWDLRGGLDVYLGRVDYAGRSVLEIGPATGFVTFSLEQRGATVVAVDLPVHGRCDLFPVSAQAVAGRRRGEALHRQAVRNVFWLAHQAFNSRAKLIESSVDDLEPVVTGFDVGLVCNVLQHRKDPVGMLLNVADRVRTIVVTEADWCDGANDDNPVLQLLTPSIREGQLYSWFMASPRLVEDVLGLKGFTIVARDTHLQPFVPAPGEPVQQVRHYTITATKLTP